ncbi:Dyp-type peroxidase [Nocardia sp. NPDC051052]|uniref:Dyp-type peroxidase n=1 Tax=Nocardia sp. NPDC051052 TaxID=3364322 RepID=UPI0037A8C206
MNQRPDQPDTGAAPEKSADQTSRVGRRQILGGAGLLGFGVAAGAVAATLTHTPSAIDRQHSAALAARGFAGAHQPGIADRAPAHLLFTAFDLPVDTPVATHDGLRSLLRAWSDTATTLMTGNSADNHHLAAGLGPAGLVITIGLGASALAKAGLDTDIPQALEPLPAFPGDALDPAHGAGDLGLQVCAEDPVIAFAATHAMTATAASTFGARPRWSQRGFLRTAAAADQPDATPRNLMGQIDGTDNPIPGDGAFEQAVWASDPAWMCGGTYLVCRRIRMLLDRWEQQSIHTQERIIGRTKDTGAPLSGGTEHTPPDFTRRDNTGNALIPANAHIRLTHPDLTGGVRMLRRGYSYDDGYDPTGQQDVGLFFQAFQANPHTAFVPAQRRLAELDALTPFIRHESSAVFAIPPGTQPGGYIGEHLLAG